MSATHPLQHAHRTFTGKAEMTREQRKAAAVSLGEWGVFSKRQIAALTGLRPADVNNLVAKTDQTGGTLNPEALPKIIELVRKYENDGSLDPDELRATLDAGVSALMLARLSGISASRISRTKRDGVNG